MPSTYVECPCLEEPDVRNNGRRVYLKALSKRIPELFVVFAHQRLHTQANTTQALQLYVTLAPNHRKPIEHVDKRTSETANNFQDGIQIHESYIESHSPTINSLGPVDHSYCCPTPPALIALEVTSNEVCVLLKCRRIATSIHGAQKRPPDQGDVLDPGILP
jgi:hypothetical protein